MSDSLVTCLIFIQMDQLDLPHAVYEADHLDVMKK